jgi:hypothetical protein
MPIFNTIIIHQYHISKVEATRLSLNPEVIKDELNRYDFSLKWQHEFSEWKKHISRTLRNMKRKELMATKILVLSSKTDLH